MIDDDIRPLMEITRCWGCDSFRPPSTFLCSLDKLVKFDPNNPCTKLRMKLNIKLLSKTLQDFLPD